MKCQYEFELSNDSFDALSRLYKMIQLQIEYNNKPIKTQLIVSLEMLSDTIRQLKHEAIIDLYSNDDFGISSGGDYLKDLYAYPTHFGFMLCKQLLDEKHA